MMLFQNKDKVERRGRRSKMSRLDWDEEQWDDTGHPMWTTKPTVPPLFSL